MKYKVGDRIEWKWNQGSVIFTGTVVRILRAKYYEVKPLHGGILFGVHENEVIGLMDEQLPRSAYCDYDRAMRGI